MYSYRSLRFEKAATCSSQKVNFKPLIYIIMKSVAKNLITCMVGASFVAISLGTLSVNAQDKPKGKPWPAPESAVKMKNPVKSDEGSLKESKDLYAQHCKSCHGAKGKGDG